MRELMQRSTPRRLTVLAFREIPDRATLRAQLDRVQRNCVPVSLTQVESALNGGPALPPRSVLLTFESGHRSVVTQALPVLTERRLPAVAFVVGELVDTEQPYWWDEAAALIRAGGWARCVPAGADVRAALAALPDPDRRRSLAELRVTARHQAPAAEQLTSEDLRALLNAGVALGNHSLGHAPLASCDGYALREQILGGHNRLLALTGVAPTAFAYPDDKPDLRAAAVLRELGYRVAFATDGRDVDPSLAPDHYALSRIAVAPDPTQVRADSLFSRLRLRIPAPASAL